MADDRTVAPGKERLRQARAAGHVAQSQELAAAVGWICAIAAITALGPGLVRGLLVAMQGALAQAGAADAADAPAWLGRITLLIGWRIAAIACAFSAGALATQLVQTRNLWAPHRLAPDVSRFWMGRNRGSTWLERAWNPAWTAVRAVVICGALAVGLHASWPSIDRLSTPEMRVIVAATGRTGLRLAFALGIAAVALGVADYLVQRWRFLNRLKTTPQEQKEEQHVREGDPAIRAQRRQAARTRQQETITRTRQAEPIGGRSDRATARL